METIGLDISSSKIGIAVLDKDENILLSEVIKFKTNISLEERANKFEKRLREIEKAYVPYSVYIEQPAMMFKGGKTTAQTMAKLQRFNGMCAYIAYRVFDMQPTMVNPRSARSKLNIKVPRGTNAKKIIIEWVKDEYKDQFKFEYTRHGNPQPGTDDRADAVIVALGGIRLDNSHQ
tara:strand:+ start:1442 stop:1969 length:528 start_codon:yes stop_codon:yes gene_type:complete